MASGQFLDSKIVRGEGPAKAKIMLIGEAPGGNEVKLGRPFVGRAGKFLDKVLLDTKLDRRQLYITNVVKSRPTKMNEGKIKDRKPTHKEVEKHMPYLLKEITKVRPRLIILMGDTACEALMGKKLAEVKGKSLALGNAQVFCTYHPAGAMRSTLRSREFGWHIRKAAAAFAS